jgi:alpha-L-fucosidase 2
MLVQSHDEAIHLLPALPDNWKNGSITGLKARGGFEIVDLAWKEGEINKLVIKSNIGGNCRIRVPNTLNLQGRVIKKAAGKNPNPFFSVTETPVPFISEKARSNKLSFKETILYDFETKAGKIYTLIKE